jgi:hypothetical protein
LIVGEIGVILAQLVENIRFFVVSHAASTVRLTASPNS